jgi:peroxiredoxin
LPDAKDKKTLSLKDFQKGANERNVVLFFFPKALTGG